MAIDDTLMSSVLDDVYNCSGDAATYNGTSVECAVRRMTTAEKAAGNASSDIEIDIQISVVDAIATSGISKADVFIFKGVSYNNIVVFQKEEYEYKLGAYLVV